MTENMKSKKTLPQTVKRTAAVIAAAVLMMMLLTGCDQATDNSKKAIEAGDTVTFGAYEQDGDAGNGKEAIQWTVLEVNGDEALLLSRNVLSAGPYHTKYTEVTWENSSIRAMLNGSFMESAFSEDEQKMILLTDVDNSRAQSLQGDAFGGADTQDRVFLLSAAETEKWLPETARRLCAATAFAKAEGVYTSKKTPVDGQPAAWWWLRSPGGFTETARCADTNGEMIYSDVNDATGGIRPAIRVKTEALK